jgi:hypothetical protein
MSDPIAITRIVGALAIGLTLWVAWSKDAPADEPASRIIGRMALALIAGLFATELMLQLGLMDWNTPNVGQEPHM